jgi:hypothetical protein
VSPPVVAVISIAIFGSSLIYILRPGVVPPPARRPSDRRAVPGAAGLRGWARWHHSTLLSLARGTLNGSVATVGLIKVGHPVAASVAEGIVAGFFSGFFQLTVMNERFSAYLNRAGSELLRIVKWAWFQAIFYGLVKAAGTLAGGGPNGASVLLGAYAMTIVFGSAQYPWEAAIAARRRLHTDQGGARERICFVADLQTMAVSVTCVGVSILNSVRVPHSRLFLLLVGLLGLTYYGLIRLRRQLLERDRGWAPEAQALVALVKN